LKKIDIHVLPSRMSSGCILFEILDALPTGIQSVRIRTKSTGDESDIFAATAFRHPQISDPEAITETIRTEWGEKFINSSELVLECPFIGMSQLLSIGPFWENFKNLKKLKLINLISQISENDLIFVITNYLLLSDLIVLGQNERLSDNFCVWLSQQNLSRFSRIILPRTPHISPIGTECLARLSQVSLSKKKIRTGFDSLAIPPPRGLVLTN
jgi:hypothetical protein